MVSIEQLDADIRNLWEQEELPQERILTQEEANCERQFIRTTKRDPTSGRHIVRLPIKPDMNPSIMLHPSLKDAIIRLRQTETKLERNPELKAQYNAFLKEYLELGGISGRGVDSRDCDLLRIVWRPEPQGPIRHYRLNTVTYGTASAPFQATRTLQQVAEDKQFTSPSASESIKKDFNIDGLLTGSSTIESAAKLQNDIVTVLKKAGFSIRKWFTNYEEVLKHVNTADRETSDVVDINLENTVKTLGLQWIPRDGIFTFKVKLPYISANEPVTKRIITSNAARLFDPLDTMKGGDANPMDVDEFNGMSKPKSSSDEQAKGEIIVVPLAGRGGHLQYRVIETKHGKVANYPMEKGRPGKEQE
ncbi:unnamed protein product [Hermetia illucens]|uniref:Uncharacterized protein n=1 Tax=Hermetia illucens TaxID=343691 RepID=A0A7R8UTU9_HERIL|nr:unnamed protein product [Hermetia illucens]